jgi:uroporphyrinogen III methyltransferase/synthase
VPLTYPGGGDTVTLVRGHEDESQTAPQIDWASLAKLDGTIVCYAGTRQLPAILESLVSHGRAKNEPAVVIYEGTLPGQHTVGGTLGELIERTTAERPRRPAILVVGRVAALREHLRWFDDRPLSGRRVVVTRPKEDAADLSDRLAAAGADAIEVPMTRISPPENWALLDKAVEQIDSFGWIVFTSVNSVDHFMQRLYRTGDVRALGAVRICAVGPSTHGRLLRYGLKSDIVPGDFRAESVVAALAAATPLSGVRVLVPCADIGREQLVEALTEAGAEVTGIVAYRTLPPEPDPEHDPDVYRMLLDRKIDAVTFTSAASIRNFSATYGAEQAADLLQQTVVAVCGPVTAEAAARLGIPVTLMPKEYTVGALVQALSDHYRTVAARV